MSRSSMKPGDLFKLTNNAGGESVEVGMGVDCSTLFPRGELVICIGKKYQDELGQDSPHRFWDIFEILVGGDRGWVYFHELEAIDEAR